MMGRLSAFLFSLWVLAASASPVYFMYEVFEYGSLDSTTWQYDVKSQSLVLGYGDSQSSILLQFGFSGFPNSAGYYVKGAYAANSTLESLKFLTPQEYHDEGGVSYPDGYGWLPDVGYFTPDSGEDSGGGSGEDGNGTEDGGNTNNTTSVYFEYKNSTFMIDRNLGYSGSHQAANYRAAFIMVFGSEQGERVYNSWLIAGGGPAWCYATPYGSESDKTGIRFPDAVYSPPDGDDGDSGSGTTTNATSVSEDYATEATLLRVLDELRNKPPSYDDSELLETLRGIASGIPSNAYDDSRVLASLAALRSEVAAKDLSVTVNAPASSFNDSNVRSDIQDVKDALTQKDATADEAGASSVGVDASGLQSAFSDGLSGIGGSVTNGVASGVSGVVDGLKGALDVSSLLSASAPGRIDLGTLNIYGKSIVLAITRTDYPSFYSVFDAIRTVFSALWCAAFLVTLVWLLRRLFSVGVAVVRWLLDMIPKALHIVAQ